MAMASEDENIIFRCAKSLDDLQWVIKMVTEDGFSPHEKRLSATFSRSHHLSFLHW